ncbi:MAG TPA: SMC-Scp complex subunit ScpB [Pyrinomonadaceae bacterium]|jgi:segregation and condensation protein B|nr:SMC-Scp complex subunit ScpB [Pyrinomonadaceae bacterium]
MSKHRRKKTGEAVAELDEALEALPDGETVAAADEAENGNPLEQVDVSGTTSFESADFAADYEGYASDDEEQDEGRELVIHDADAEDRAEEFARWRAEARASGEGEEAGGEVAPGGQPRELAALVAICETLIFVSEEPLSVKAMADLLGEDRGWVQVAVEELAREFNERNGGLTLREVAGGWQFATRPEHHEHIRAYLKSKPSAKLSLAALETLAVIAYKQPVTVPEILEIRGVQSSSAIKTLLDKRLIVAKGRKETVGRPMMYGTSREFLLQFGLKDLSELPNVEDFEDLAGGGS